ncbi:rhodanese-like domain-containing protein [Streptomyces sp. NPDC001410]|uniref:rhodanese-like domain-containing protein n=1 Tax=Streptomyces sp. NPDC001410 TaxID=3364574 RepID=UPI0036C7E901
MTAPVDLDIAQARTRLHEFAVIDVRTPAEYASGHLVVCASGARSENTCKLLAEQGVTTATLAGGTGAWAAEGHDLHRPAVRDARAGWSMERQVRFTAGALVLLGLLLGLLVHPAFQFLSAGIAGGLVFSALMNTCGMAVVLGKLPHNRPRTADLDDALAALRGR